MKISKTQLKEMIRDAVKKHLNNSLFCEQNEYEQEKTLNIPIELQDKAKEILQAFVFGKIRWYALENLFFDLLPWASDPMEVVTYIYDKMNVISKDNFEQEATEAQTRKAQLIYDKLFDLAQQERTKDIF